MKIPNEYFQLPNVFEPSFALNADQQKINYVLAEEQYGTIRITKKRCIGMTTFLVLYALHHARPQEWGRSIGSLFIVPNRAIARNTIEQLRVFHPKYDPHMNNVGIQIVTGFDFNVVHGRSLENTMIIVDEIAPDETEKASDYLMNLQAHWPARIIVSTSIPKSYEVLFPDLKRNGFTILK